MSSGGAIVAGDGSQALPKKKRSRSFLRILGTVTGITLLSRVLGLIRDILMASIFGLTLYADAFYVAWTLPNLFRRLCGEGALSSAFLPVFVDVKTKKGPVQARALTNGTVTRLALVLAVLVIVMELLLSSVWYFGDLVNSGMARSILTLSQILLPYLWFICLAGLLSGLLHSEGDFARPAGMAVLLNLVWIAALLLTGDSWLFGAEFHWGPEQRVIALAVALVLGGAMQLGLQLWGCSSVGFPIRPSFEVGEDYRRVKSLYVPIAFGMAIEQLNIFLDRGIAWLCVDSAGGVAALYYSMRLIQLPIALIGTALATVLFPAFARLAAEGLETELNSHLKTALRITVFVTLPAAVGLCMMSEEIIALLFERGRFGAEESARTAFCLVCYGLSVVMISLNATQIRAFHARQDSKTPVRVGVMAVVLNFVLNLILVQFLAEAGLALATSLAATFSFFVLFVKNQGELSSFLVAFVRCSALSAVMSVACLGTLAVLPGEAGSLMRVVVPILVAVLVYGGLAFLLRVPEWSQAILLRQSGNG